MPTRDSTFVEHPPTFGKLTVVQIETPARDLPFVTDAGILTVISATEEPEGEWQEVFAATLDSNDSGWDAMTLRSHIAASALADVVGTKIRVTLTAASGEAADILAAYVGHKGGGDNYDFDGNQVALAVGASGSFTVGAGATAVTDEADFAFDGAQDLVLSFAFDTPGGMRRGSKTGATPYYKSGSDAATTNASGYSGLSSNESRFVAKVEVFA